VNPVTANFQPEWPQKTPKTQKTPYPKTTAIATGLVFVFLVFFVANLPTLSSVADPHL
jgi:hypothetical protein